MTELKIFLLGPPQVELDREPVDFKRRKALALLIYLAVSSQPHSRDALATLLYPDHSQSRARAYLRRDLAVLNTNLPGDWLIAGRETLELVGDSDPSSDVEQTLWLDVDQFRRRLAACQDHNHPPETVCPDCLSLLTEAAQLYTDDFLAGFTLRDSAEFDDWQFFQAESLRQELASVLEKLVRGHSAQGACETAIPYARRWLALDPLHEPAQRSLMELYDQSGQPAAALRQYEEYVDLLEEELGLPPEEETRTLYEAIKAKRILGPYFKAEKQEGKAARKEDVEASQASPVAEQAAPPEAPLPIEQLVPHHEQLAQPTPFVGRQEEYEQLVSVVAQIRSGQGQIVLIEGEPGIGKSRLAQEALRFAQEQGLNTLWQKCYQSEQTMPYQVLIDLVGQMLAGWPAETFRHLPPAALAELAQLTPEIASIFPDLPPLPDGLAEARQARLFRALQQFVAAPAVQHPLVFVIDDIQWADHVTLQFLQHLAHHLVTQPILLICTYRTEEVATDEQLTTSIHDLQREPHAVHLPLARLTLLDAKALIESLSITPDAALEQWLYRETEGNPFFLMSILQSLREQGILSGQADTDWQIDLTFLQEADTRLTLPEALRQSVQDRLRRVPQRARQLLDVAAVYGRRFDFGILQAITGQDTMALVEVVEELLTRQLLREEKEGGYDFSHDKIREVVYRELSQMRRMLLHRQVAEALEASGLDRVGTLADHFEKGEVWDKAITYLAQAAARARELFAMQEALSFYDRAIALVEKYPRSAPPEMRLDLREQRGETRGLMGGHVEEAVADLLLVLDAARDAGDQERERTVLIRIGQVYRYGDHYSEALEYLKAALDVARRSGDERRVADALYHLGSTVWSQGHNDQALTYHQEAVEICQRLELSDLVAVQAYHGLGEAHFLAGRAEEAIELYENSLVLARQIRDKGYESENLGNMGMAMQLYGIADYERAKEVFTRSLKISQSANLEWHAVQVLGPLGLACGLSGNYRQALDYLNKSIPIAESIGARRFQSLLLDMYGTIWQELNLLERAKVAHEQALAMAQAADAGWWLPRIQANLAIDRLRLGDEDIEETLQTTFEQAMNRRLEMHAIRCLEGLAELALVHGEPQQALRYADQLQELAEPGAMRESLAQARRWRGEAWLALGDLEEAAAELAQALSLAREIGRPRLEWDLYLALTKVNRAGNDEATAAQHEARVNQIIGEIAANLEGLAEPGQAVELDPEQSAELFKAALERGQALAAKPVVIQVGTEKQPAANGSGLLDAFSKPRFIQEELIAKGGMSEVYQGWDTETDQPVAIKRLKPELVQSNPEAVQRLIREGEILRQLNHPNIVKMLATVETEKQPIVVMEYVPGGSLQDLLRKQSQLPLEQVLNIGLELADAMARAHHLGVIHRDLKPANVLLAADGTPRLSDFGIAYLVQWDTRLTQEGAILGTTVYMSPEAWRGETLDARSDIWSFGAMLYEMLSGRPPFVDEQPVAIMAAILNEPLLDLYQFRPEAPPGLVELISQMLVKDRALRMDSMRQVAAGLELIQRNFAE